MKHLLMATIVFFQVILKQIWGLDVMSETLRKLPGLIDFPWEFLICTAMVCLIIKCRHTLRRQKDLSKSISACIEEHHKFCEKTRQMKPAYEVLKSSVVAACPLSLQTLCLAALNTYLNNSSPKDTVDLVGKEWKSKPPKLSSHVMMMAHLQKQLLSLHKAAESFQSHMIDAKKTLMASQMNGEQLQKKITDGVKENTHLQENLQVMAQEIVGWKQRVQEPKEQIKVIEHSSSRMKENVEDKENQVKSLTETMLKIIHLPDHLRNSNFELYKKREPIIQDHLVYPSAVDLSKLINIANLNVSLKRLEGKRQEIFKKVCEEKQMNKEITKQTKSLKNEQASLQAENSQLENEIDKLQRKLQILPEVHKQHVLQLERNSIEEESYCSEIEKERCKADRNINFTYQKCNLYKKMAEGLDKELERTTSFYYNLIIYYDKKVREKGLEALATERKLNALRKENDYKKEILAKVELGAPVFPRCPFYP